MMSWCMLLWVTVQSLTINKTKVGEEATNRPVMIKMLNNLNEF